MVTTLYGLFKVVVSSLLLEFVSVAAIVYGVSQLSVPAAWIVAGASGLLKAAEIDVGSDGGDA